MSKNSIFEIGFGFFDCLYQESLLLLHRLQPRRRAETIDVCFSTDLPATWGAKGWKWGCGKQDIPISLFFDMFLSFKGILGCLFFVFVVWCVFWCL